MVTPAGYGDRNIAIRQLVPGQSEPLFLAAGTVEAQSLPTTLRIGGGVPKARALPPAAWAERGEFDCSTDF